METGAISASVHTWRGYIHGDPHDAQGMPAGAEHQYQSAPPLTYTKEIKDPTCEKPEWHHPTDQSKSGATIYCQHRWQSALKYDAGQAVTGQVSDIAEDRHGCITRDSASLVSKQTLEVEMPASVTIEKGNHPHHLPYIRRRGRATIIFLLSSGHLTSLTPSASQVWKTGHTRLHLQMKRAVQWRKS
ncbi:MAG: hypothetical protein IPJ13_06590 [Saprospiraceae bacterium]|nr:hypothetical protein [Saprospiraceae bacterium]